MRNIIKNNVKHPPSNKTRKISALIEKNFLILCYENFNHKRTESKSVGYKRT